MKGAVLVLLLAGCAAVQPLVNPIDGIVGEAVAAARAPAAEQAATLARAQQAGTNTPVERLRLATLLATLPPPLRDDARAVKLLEPLADAAAPGVGRFAALLSSQIAERQRLARELDTASRDAASAARERERSDKERDKREEALKQQLEALRAIERGILEREEKLRREKK
jgi:signal transduction histidine kinase